MSEEFSFVGLLRSVKSTLELSVIDRNKYGPLLITTFSNLSEILLKGFLITSEIKSLPPTLNKIQKDQEITRIQDKYLDRDIKFTTLKAKIVALTSFNLKTEFLTICDFFQILRQEYRNGYTHGFYSYRSDIPTETIRDTINHFIKFLEILETNWEKLSRKVSEDSNLRVLMYFCTFEKRNCDQRWRKFNETLHRNTTGSFLGVEFDGVRILLALQDLGITNEGEYCDKVLGYDFNLWRLISPLLQPNGQTSRQIKSQLPNRGNILDLRKVELILDDMSSLGKIRKQYEHGKAIFLILQ